MIGAIAGGVIVVAFFLLPFASLSGVVPRGSTLFGALSNAVTNLPQTQTGGSLNELVAALILTVAGLLILVAGIVGAFPLGSGVLSVFGMTMVTLGPYIIGQAGTVGFSDFGTGYFAIWAAAILVLAISFAHKGESEENGMQGKSVGDTETTYR